MEDQQIVELYWQRNENAIAETAHKYGNYLNTISRQIVGNAEDAEECVSDTYHDAWKAMPPHRPQLLSTFLGKITRRISIDCWRKNTAAKRGGGEVDAALEELDYCVAGKDSVEGEIQRQELVKILNEFLKSLPDQQRKIFMRRYWYLDPIPDIAEQYGFSENKVTVILFRIRKKLRAELEKEGYA